MRILLRAFPIFLLMGLCTVSLAQSSSPSNPPNTQIDATQSPQQNNGTPAVSVGTANGPVNPGGGTSTQLTQQQIDDINQTISLLQNKLQQINDPNDPMAVKLQTTIDKLQAILNNQ